MLGLMGGRSRTHAPKRATGGADGRLYSEPHPTTIMDLPAYRQQPLRVACVQYDPKVRPAHAELVTQGRRG